MQKQPSLLSQSLYDISVDCTEGTDPFRQSVRYQQFSRQAEKLGLYGSYREEYIRFLRIAYGSLEYGRTDGLSGISYTDAELKKLYGFDESPGRLNEKMLYQQGYEMGRAERETWGMVAVISIMKELQAIDPKESTEATVGKSSPPTLKPDKNIVYRALNEKDFQRLNKGLGLEAKNPHGQWTLEQHIRFGSGDKAVYNDPYISTTTDIEVAKGFDQAGSGLGIIEIDLNKVTSEYYKAYELFPRGNGVEGIPYQYSVWQQEISIYQTIPYEAISKH